MGVAPRPYQAQVAAGGTTADLGSISPDAFGAGVGRAVEEFGGAVGRYAEVKMDVARNEAWSDWSLKFEEAKAKARDDALNRRMGAGDTADAGWAGHADMVGGETDARMNQLLEGLKDPVLRKQAGLRVTEFRNDLVGQERTFEAGKRLAKLGSDTRQIGMLAAQGVLNSTAISTDLPKAVEDLDSYIGNLDVAPDIKEGLRRELAPGLLDAGVQNRINAGDLDTAEKMVKAPAFAELGPDRSQALLNEIEVERRRRESAARAEQAAAVSAAKEGLATQKALLDTGAGTPADWEKLATGYDAIGDTSAAVEARAKGGEMTAVQGSRDYTVPQMQAEIARLDAKAAKPGGLTPGEATLRTGLNTQLTQSQARLGRTGGALEQYQYATSKPIPGIDFNDPASLRQRATYAAAAAQKYGQMSVQPLLDSELPGLRQLTEGGPADKMRALEAIAGFGDPRAVEGAGRQLAGAGDEGGFRIAATRILTPGGRQVARDILRGGDALKANPSLFNDKEAREAFAAYGPALQGLGPDFAADTYVAARNLYASRMAAQGLTGWSPGEFRTAIDAALGGYHEGAYYKGGSWTFKNQRVVIPTGWTADGVFRRIARMTGEDLGNAKVTGAGRWPDGSPLYTGQLREMIPVFMGGTRYGFRDARSGRLLPSAQGGPFMLDMAKVPWR
ncbi:hypothetical protein HZY97_16260 [Sphingomonas sp. R-74633]|uniref:hypothetical protein n=1 Tax=Sphingomonas sp. R-74633 TaxID=2751188 RepID=UPI0015D254BE|nr:hypothetical protein [Sphingomonas sp. R-74633]NYT42327.1 hypothetical protein [Sphingomonas sp. R-74633]